MEQRRLFVVRGTAKHGTITYNCPTAEWALRKVRDFQASEYQNITIADAHGRLLTEADLIAGGESSIAGLSEEAIPAAPRIVRQPALV